jgi:DNA-binding transcriptional MerR regulator
MTAETLLTVGAVLEATTITYRQLVYWEELGLIAPAVPSAGTGTRRLYSPDVVERIKDLAARIEACPLHHGSTAA